MKKTLLYSLILIMSINFFSCALLQFSFLLLEAGDAINTISSKDKENDIPGYVHVYIENKTDEIIVVNLVDLDSYGEKTGKTVELARVPKGEIKMLNIQKGRRKKISVMGGHTRKIYLESVCETDFETFVIF
jgi:hypothetical protein